MYVTIIWPHLTRKWLLGLSLSTNMQLGLNLKSDSWLQKLQLSFSFKSLHNKLPIAPEQQFMYNTEFLHVSFDHRNCLTSRSQCQLSFANAKHNILDLEPSPFPEVLGYSPNFLRVRAGSSSGYVFCGEPVMWDVYDWGHQRPLQKNAVEPTANTQPPFYFLEVHVTQYVFSFCVFLVHPKRW